MPKTKIGWVFQCEYESWDAKRISHFMADTLHILMSSGTCQVCGKQCKPKKVVMELKGSV